MSRRLPPPGQWFWLPRSSIDVIAAIGPTAFAVLATITSHADENGIAYPSICRMAARLGMHRSTVQRAIQTLINAKLIEAVGRCDSTGAQTSYSFKILPPEIPVAIGAHPPVANEDQGCSKPSPPPGLQMLRPPVANGAHELDPLLTRSNKQEKEPASPASVSAKSTFDEWWKVFPKKAAKPKAAAAYRAALKAIVKDSEIVCDDPAEWLLAKTKDFAASDKGRGEYCPYPTTWLNQARYADDPTTWRDAKANSGGQQSNYRPVTVPSKKTLNGVA